LMANGIWVMVFSFLFFMLNTGSEGMICAGSRRLTSQYHASERKSGPAAAGALWVQGALGKQSVLALAAEA
ncbi:MAG TPA: hypothetical protein PKD74_04720, partial [Candidatus Dependentiae bacterium]|nr:hypothetical protein [Candidatus Dependentiae bacterium]